MAHSQTAHRLAKPPAKTGSRVTTTEFPSVPERRTGPEPHAPGGRIHAVQGPFKPIGVRGRVESTRRQGHPVGTPAFQSSACATAQAFDHKTGVPAGKASRRQEDQRITGGPVRQECGNATYPATLTVGTAGPGKGTHLLIILSLYRLIDRRCSSPLKLVLAYRGRPPIGRP